MLGVRVIPCLLVRGAGLVKTVRFRDPRYVGDPVNAIRIFNDKAVDELMVLDITATEQGRGPPFELLRDLASECFMPLAFGGGIRNLEDMRRILAAGAEKCVVNELALTRLELLSEAAREFGSQSLVVSIDVRKRMLGGYQVHGGRGTRATGLEPLAFARRVEDAGAGEILLTSIERDGTREGYDLELIRRVSDAVRIPVVASGGAGSVEHMLAAIREGHASAVAAGSMFVFTGRHRAVLITYPSEQELSRLSG